VARDNSGNVLASQAVSFRISILSGSVSGSEAYSETHSGLTTNAFGLVELEIGKGTPVTGTFSSIDWGSNSYFVKIEMDPAGGSTYQVLSTSQLLSVPYAMFSETSATAIDAVKITGDQTIAGKKSFTNSISTGNNPITDVSNPVNKQDAATKTYVDKMFSVLGVGPNNFAGIAEDIEGNFYKTVQIGNQVWMAENLRTTKLNDGTAIPLVTDNTAWGNLTTPGYCWYENDKATYGNTYGALYNWYAVNTGKLCPTGWHVPSDGEWTILRDYLGGESVAGGKMKEAGTTHWQSPNTGATNESGFSALPGGFRFADGSFYNVGGTGYWWSSTEFESYWAKHPYLLSNYSGMFQSGYFKNIGLSVRCVRD
jgi:uncharacterized protein (TIGR02145 family)